MDLNLFQLKVPSLIITNSILIPEIFIKIWAAIKPVSPGRQRPTWLPLCCPFNTSLTFVSTAHTHTRFCSALAGKSCEPDFPGRYNLRARSLSHFLCCLNFTPWYWNADLISLWSIWCFYSGLRILMQRQKIGKCQ